MQLKFQTETQKLNVSLSFMKSQVLKHLFSLDLGQQTHSQLWS